MCHIDLPILINKQVQSYSPCALDINICLSLLLLLLSPLRCLDDRVFYLLIMNGDSNVEKYENRGCF